MSTEPVRILNLFTIMNRGGAETMVMNYYRNLDRSKLQFDFMVHRQELGAFDDEIESLGGRIYRMPAIRPWAANDYRKRVREFYNNHPEYKIIHSHMSELGYYDFLEAERVGIPVRICHAHNRPYGFDLKSPVRWYYKTRMLPHITHMFMCGEESGEWLFGEKNNGKFIQLNNAIDAKKYIYNKEKRRRVRSDLKITDDQIVIGHIGRFDLQKNHKFLIDVFKTVHEQNPKTLLLLVGDDSSVGGKEMHQRVKQLNLSQWVKFMGTRSDVPDLLQAMDVFVLPSLFEGLSVASIEAQAAGLPVLISTCVPIECKKTDLVHVLPLEAPLEEWAKMLLEIAQIPRRDTFEEIQAAGFDITENAKWLQKFYLQEAGR